MHAHLLLALLLAMPLFQEPAEISASTPSARCTWASEDPQALLVRLRSGMELSGGDGAYSAWSRWVESHAANHAWSGRFDGPDPFAVRKVDCPAAILDAIASVQDLTDEYRAPSLYVELALVLERNGRVDSALGMLKNAVEVAKDANAWTQVARLAEQTAKLYARHGLWAKAEEQSTGWIPYAQCGNCLPSEKRRIAEFRAHCLVELGRWDDAREVVRKQAMRTDGLTGSLAECYIRASVARGGSTARAAFEELFLGPDTREEKEFLLRHCEIKSLPMTERMKRLDELCLESKEHVQEALKILLANPDLLDARMKALTAPRIPREDYGWLRILAALGDPVVDAAIRRELELAADADKPFLLECDLDFVRARRVP